MVGDVEFWRRRKNSFRARDNGENHSLWAYWDSITQTYGSRGPDEARRIFEKLTNMAVRRLPCPQDVEPRRVWLDELRRENINCSSLPIEAVFNQHLLDDWPKRFGSPAPVGGDIRSGIIAADQSIRCLQDSQPGDPYTEKEFKGEVVVIERLFEASVLLCEELESRAEASSAKRDEQFDNGGRTNCPAESKRKRGRPVKIPATTKDAALGVLKAGGSYKDAAAKLYDTKYPTSQQVKNVSSILRHYKKTSSGPGSLHKPVTE